MNATAAPAPAAKAITLESETQPADRDKAPDQAKQPDRPGQPDRSKISRDVAGVGIAGNVALSAFKLAAGIFGNSTAMISDAVHSLSDVFATAIAFAGVKLAAREADSGHPYGHERFECVASLALGAILALTGAAIGLASMEGIATRAYLDAPAPGVLALVAAVVSIAVKEGMFWYTRHWARAMDSSAFMADAWHHRSDALSSAGALAGIGAAMLGFPAGDALASLIICAIILKVAFDVLKEALGNMTDTPCEAHEEREIASCVAKIDGVVRIDSLRTRKFGNRVYVDVEIAVDGDLPLVEAHAIAEAAHDAVERRFPSVKHIMIHENPA